MSNTFGSLSDFNAARKGSGSIPNDKLQVGGNIKEKKKFENKLFEKPESDGSDVKEKVKDIQFKKSYLA